MSYAAKDAQDIAHAIELGAVRLLGDKNKVHIRLLATQTSDTPVKLHVPDAKVLDPTKQNFEAAFADFRRARPQDVLIVYLAGHGISLRLNQQSGQPGGDTYLYLTREATTTDLDILKVEAARKAMAISSEELVQLVTRENKALKRVLILDTCAAGAIAPSLIGKRDLPSDQLLAIERLKDNTGFYVLMGAAADKVSYEATRYAQGLMTYALLDGIRGPALTDESYAFVSRLFEHAQTAVQEMAKNIGGVQRPYLLIPDTSENFAIGRFTADEQRGIKLALPKPIILSPYLQNERLRFDNLKLTPLLRQHLRQVSFVGARGGEAPIVFVEATEMVDAITPSGGYTVEGDTLKITVVLVRNNETIGREISVAGKVSEKETLVKQLANAVTQAAQRQ